MPWIPHTDHFRGLFRPQQECQTPRAQILPSQNLQDAPNRFLRHSPSMSSIRQVGLPPPAQGWHKAISTRTMAMCLFYRRPCRTPFPVPADGLMLLAASLDISPGKVPTFMAHHGCARLCGTENSSYGTVASNSLTGNGWGTLSAKTYCSWMWKRPPISTQFLSKILLFFLPVATLPRDVLYSLISSLGVWTLRSYPVEQKFKKREFRLSLPTSAPSPNSSPFIFQMNQLK